MSGKEIFVFFSRFGVWSFVGIAFSFFLIYFFIKFLFNCENIKLSKFSYILNIFIYIVFSSSMFGGIINLLNFNQKLINFAIFLLILLFLLLILKKGMIFLNKFNLFLLPLIIFSLIFLVGGKIQYLPLQNVRHGHLSIFYSFLYIVLNISSAVVIISKYAGKFSKKQKARVAFFSALLLCVMLIICNIVLLQNPSGESMPILSLFENEQYIFLKILVFFASTSSLLTNVYSLSQIVKVKVKNDYLVFLISVFLPLAISLIGYSQIIEYLYPLASVCAVGGTGELFFKTFFKRGDDKIHSSRKQT